jgi:hypothetical protein
LIINLAQPIEVVETPNSMQKPTTVTALISVALLISTLFGEV